MGMIPFSSFATFSELLSTQTTSLPLSAKQLPTTRPTYPVPITAIFIRESFYRLSMGAIKYRLICTLEYGFEKFHVFFLQRIEQVVQTLYVCFQFAGQRAGRHE